MRKHSRRSLSLLIVIALAAPACETATTPTDPIPERVTVPFSGTLTINGAATHRFEVPAAGAIDVRLKTLAPETTVALGISLGIWTGASCNIVLADDNAVLNALLIGMANGSGSFCARVYDSGKVTGPTDYSIEVRHF